MKKLVSALTPVLLSVMRIVVGFLFMAHGTQKLFAMPASAPRDPVELMSLAGAAGVLEMSGGERARVLLARLLATRAPLLVADEPAAGLDPDAQLLTLELLRAEAARGAAVVVTLHDLTLAARFCDRLVVLSSGRVAAEGAPAEALAPEVLRSVFGLEGALVETAAGAVVSARRAKH